MNDLLADQSDSHTDLLRSVDPDYNFFNDIFASFDQHQQSSYYSVEELNEVQFTPPMNKVQFTPPMNEVQFTPPMNEVQFTPPIFTIINFNVRSFNAILISLYLC